jgi:hypothetical protein
MRQQSDRVRTERPGFDLQQGYLACCYSRVHPPSFTADVRASLSVGVRKPEREADNATPSGSDVMIACLYSYFDALYTYS